MGKRILWIDAVRALCVLYVVGIWHLDGFFGLNDCFYNQYTSILTDNIMVTFVLLSGFFAANKASFNEIKDYWLFFKKKWIRSYPLFLIALLLFACCGIHSWGSLLRYSLGAGLLYEPFPITIWFITMLYTFFILTPLVIRPNKVITKLVIFLLTYLVFYYANMYWGVNFNYQNYWPWFCLGICINKCGILDKISEIKLPHIVIMLGAFVLMMKTDFYWSRYAIVIMDCTFVLLISSICYMVLEKCKSKLLIKIVSVLSYASMSTYLFHDVVFTQLQRWCGDLSLLTACLLGIPMAFIFGYLAQLLYDSLCKTLTNMKKV